VTQPTDPNEPTAGAAPDSDVDANNDPAAVPESPDSDESEPTPNSEAARWRTKLRDTEAQRDALTERLTGYQRRECEAAVADLLDEPADLWDIGQADLAGFYNDDGELDEGPLRAAAGALCEMRPKLAKPRGPQWQNFGQYAAPPPPPKAGWNSVLKQ
jgi:hypothetical protein